MSAARDLLEHRRRAGSAAAQPMSHTRNRREGEPAPSRTSEIGVVGDLGWVAQLRARHPELVCDTSANLLEHSVAVFDRYRTYRYLLARWWSTRPDVIFTMLNPSTADASTPDPTLRRCLAFARAHGFGGVQIVNLFALRSPDPSALRNHPDPVGRLNHAFLDAAGANNANVVVAWGAQPIAAHQAQRTITRLRDAGAQLLCLGTTKTGQPRHPLYVRGDTRLRPFEPELP